jgi:iron(III) transport system substrate-binding protein
MHALRTTLVITALTALTAAAAGCSSGTGGSKAAAAPSPITLYTCASANVEQAVIKGFQAGHPGTKVNVFRAPTGQLNARVAADQRSGGIQADVIWACDPLTMHGYDGQHLLRAWTPPNANEIDAKYRTANYTGIDLLYMVAVVHTGTPAPTAWSDLTGAAYKGRVAVPSPTFAASALGALGYFSGAPGYGLAFYRSLKANGAVQVNAPADALTGVEQGTYRAALTLANAAYTDQKKGSPITVVWPQPGGIAIYAPIGLTVKKHVNPVAEQFASYAASRAAQTLMAAQNTYVTIAGITGPPLPAGSPSVSPDWTALAANTKAVLAEYGTVFGG